MKVPSKLILDELDVVQKEFIWNSKRPKIKHSILIADYSEGAYKNVEIKSKLMSLKRATLFGQLKKWPVISWKVQLASYFMQMKFEVSDLEI